MSLRAGDAQWSKGVTRVFSARGISSEVHSHRFFFWGGGRRTGPESKMPGNGVTNANISWEPK